MPSKAREAFDKNAKDIEQLLKFHEDAGGNEPGRRYGLEVLNKSAVVLITAFWEAYCEDIASEGLEHIVDKANSADVLPTELKKILAKKIRDEKTNELEMWKLADDGWRQYLKSHLMDLKEQRDRRLNTPKTQQIDELFKSALGIEKISTSWKWPKNMTAVRASKKLDKYVTLRGEIAHRGQNKTSVTKTNAKDYFEFVKSLVSRTGGHVNSHVRKITGEKLW